MWYSNWWANINIDFNLQVASSFCIICVSNMTRWSSCGWVLPFFGSLWMIRSPFRKCYCRPCASRSRFSTSFFDSIRDWFLPSVNIWSANEIEHVNNVLFSVLGDVWKIHRKSLNYSFNLKILQTFIPTFIENAQKLVDDLAVNVGKTKQFDMLTYTTKSALNMICGESKMFRGLRI